MPTPLSIIHAPHGAGAHYFVEMEERIPREPVGGDMVTIGFLTKPGNRGAEVALHWTRNGRPQPPIGGRALARYADFDRWQAEIGVVEAGDHIEYWIIADADGQTLESPHFTFVARRWCTLASCSAVDPIEDGFRLATLDNHGNRGPCFRIRRYGASDVIQLALADTPVPETSAPLEPTIAVSAGACSLAVSAKTGLITFDPGGAMPALALRLRWLEEGDGRLVGCELTGSLEADEVLVGFGERFNALDQRGRAFDTIVYEQYKNHGNRTYIPMPFFLSNKGYGCLVEGTGYVAYDLGRTVPDRWRCLAMCGHAGSVAVDFMAGAPLKVVRDLTALTGRPDAPPPAWVFGPWMSSNEWNNQARVEHEVAMTRQHGIPATVLVIEAWSDEITFYTWNGAQYTPRPGDQAPRLADFTYPVGGPWPDPKRMVDDLHADGIRLVLWQIPALKHGDEPNVQHDADVAYAIEQGYVIRRNDGSVYRNPAFWFNQAPIPDFTNPAAATWWLSKRAYLLDEFGVDGFKTDGGEHLQGSDIVAFDGRTGGELVNAYPNLYTGAYYRFVRDRRNGDGVIFSRAGYTGAGAFPTHWAGDENSSWEAFRRSIVAGLTAGLGGILFWGWDVAGFSQALPTAELYLRATAMAAFCPIMQYHSEYTPPGEPSKDRTPWRVQEHCGDARVIPGYRRFANIRMNLLPYLQNEAAHAVAQGEPLLRPLLLDFPDDPVVWRVDDAFCLGRDLLVAPIVEEGATVRKLYLPQGEWCDFWTGATVRGGQWLEVPAPWDQIPVFVHGGAVIPLNVGEWGELGDSVGASLEARVVTLVVYPGGEGAGELVLSSGARVNWRTTVVDGGVEVRVSGAPVPLRIKRLGGVVERVEAGEGECAVIV